jgi:hypothetical protein
MNPMPDFTSQGYRSADCSMWSVILHIAGFQIRLGSHAVSIVSKILTGVMGAAILLAGPSASAAKYLVSFSGTMTSGKDSTGVLGEPSDLTGKSVVATYAIDTLNIYDNEPGVVESVVPTWASIKIGDATYLIPQEHFNTLYSAAFVGKLEFVYYTLIDGNPFERKSIIVEAYSPWFQPRIDFGANAVISAAGTGEFVIRRCCGPQFVEFDASGIFDIDTVTVTAVPEPAAWALMITGFGLTGAALRRRRALAA